ncbi:MAG: zf-HC2 domain-containing protein [candidate division NC10 bacterium]
MSCREFESRLHPFVDGELDVAETLAAEAHAAECPHCRGRVAGERRFRQLLRRQPRESAPPEFRAMLRARLRRSARVAAIRPWLLVPAAAAAAALVWAVLPGASPSATLVGNLVDKHIAYAQIEQPAEFVSADRVAVETWFRQRAGLRVTVADFSPAGIRLAGARIAEAGERKAAHVLYEKGRTLLSVFTVPVAGREGELSGTRVTYRGRGYVTQERKGYRTVSWTEGQVVFGLVSMLDYDSILQCADTLRTERSREARL